MLASRSNSMYVYSLRIWALFRIENLLDMVLWLQHLADAASFQLQTLKGTLKIVIKHEPIELFPLLVALSIACIAAAAIDTCSGASTF